MRRGLVENGCLSHILTQGGRAHWRVGLDRDGGLKEPLRYVDQN